MLREGKKTVLVYNFNLLFEYGNSHEIAPSKYARRLWELSVTYLLNNLERCRCN